MGFCVFNDVAVAIAAIRRWGFRERILGVDLDLHDGNGTRLRWDEAAGPIQQEQGLRHRRARRSYPTAAPEPIARSTLQGRPGRGQMARSGVW
jgi:hypothetical protein